MDAKLLFFFFSHKSNSEKKWKKSNVPGKAIMRFNLHIINLKTKIEILL